MARDVGVLFSAKIKGELGFVNGASNYLCVLAESAADSDTIGTEMLVISRVRNFSKIYKTFKYVRVTKSQ